MNDSEMEYIPQDMQEVPLIDSGDNQSEHELVDQAQSNNSDFSMSNGSPLALQIAAKHDLDINSKAFIPSQFSNQFSRVFPMLALEEVNTLKTTFNQEVKT